VRMVEEDRPELEADQRADPDDDRGPTDPHQ
jgi:hypothetical protein